VNEALLLSAGKIAGSVVLLSAVLWSVSRLAKLARLDPEVGRKLVHISLGLYCLTFPYVFDEAWEVGATCTLALLVFLAARGVARQSLGGGLHAVARKSYGELLFAVAVALLFWLKDGHFISTTMHQKVPPGDILYILPILVLTLCDAASALVGSRYGRRVFEVEDGKKSVEGVVAFAMTAWLLSLIAFLMLTDIGRGEAVLLAFITAVFGALLEAASWRGLDNLFIPLGLYFLLSNLLYMGAAGLAALATMFLLLLIALLLVARHRPGEERHFLAVGSTLFFCIALFAEPTSVVTPAVAVATYIAALSIRKPDRPPHDALNLLVVVTAIALLYFVVSHVARMDTIHGFNLSFAGLAAGIAARFARSVWPAAVAVVIAWGAMSIRTYWAEAQSEPALLFTLVGLFGIVGSALVGWFLRRRDYDRPWLVLGGVCMFVGLIVLPLSPP
jgi:dolichol kinase